MLIGPVNLAIAAPLTLPIKLSLPVLAMAKSSLSGLKSWEQLFNVTKVVIFSTLKNRFWSQSHRVQPSDSDLLIFALHRFDTLHLPNKAAWRRLCRHTHWVAERRAAASCLNTATAIRRTGERRRAQSVVVWQTVEKPGENRSKWIAAIRRHGHCGENDRTAKVWRFFAFNFF